MFQAHLEDLAGKFKMAKVHHVILNRILDLRIKFWFS